MFKAWSAVGVLLAVCSSAFGIINLQLTPRHLIDLAEFLCGPIAAIRGAVFSTLVPDRPLPLGAAVGHGATAASDIREAVENEDVATFTATFASGAGHHVRIEGRFRAG